MCNVANSEPRQTAAILFIYAHTSFCGVFVFDLNMKRRNKICMCLCLHLHSRRTWRCLYAFDEQQRATKNALVVVVVLVVPMRMAGELTNPFTSDISITATRYTFFVLNRTWHLRVCVSVHHVCAHTRTQPTIHWHWGECLVKTSKWNKNRMVLPRKREETMTRTIMLMNFIVMFRACSSIHNHMCTVYCGKRSNADCRLT